MMQGGTRFPHPFLQWLFVFLRIPYAYVKASLPGFCCRRLSMKGWKLDLRASLIDLHNRVPSSHVVFLTLHGHQFSI